MPPPYEDLGIDVAGDIQAADIAQYSVDIGTRPDDGKVVGLGYQATGGAFIYRRSIAKEVFGTDDPDTIGAAIGAGSNGWDKFYEAAETLKGKGYGIISGDGDLWHAVENSSEQGWIVDGKLNIDPKREAFLDLSKELKDNNYHNDTQDWQDAWFADMKGEGGQGHLRLLRPRLAHQLHHRPPTAAAPPWAREPMATGRSARLPWASSGAAPG